MNLSPDSMLLWPRNDVKDKAFLINNSPEFESQKTEKVSNVILYNILYHRTWIS